MNYRNLIWLERCSKCNAPFEEFSEEELGMCVIILSTFIHREPTLAATMLPEILRFNSKQVLTSFLDIHSRSFRDSIAQTGRKYDVHVADGQ